MGHILDYVPPGKEDSKLLIEMSGGIIYSVELILRTLSTGCTIRPFISIANGLMNI